MTSYTGTVRTIPLQGVGEAFPMVNPFNNYRMPSGFRPSRRVYTAVLTGTAAAIATDDYTFTVTIVDRDLTVDACFMVDPVGLSYDGNNYNTYTVYNSDGTLICSSAPSDVIAGEPLEIARANTVAERKMEAGETVQFKVTGTASGRIINHGTMVFIVCSPA